MKRIDINMEFRINNTFELDMSFSMDWDTYHEFNQYALHTHARPITIFTGFLCDTLKQVSK